MNNKDVQRNNLRMAPRVLNVLLDNRIGGPQIRVLSVAKELRRYGIETVMVAPKREGDFAQWATKEDFKVHQIILHSPQHLNNFGSIYANFKWFLTFALSVLAIAKIISKEKVNIVHINGLLNLQASLAALLKRKRIVWYLSSTLFPKVIVWFLMPFVRLVSNHIVIIARRLERYHFGNRKIGIKGNVSLIYEAVDTNVFNPINISKGDKDKLKIEFNIEPCDRIVGCVGSISPVKGYEYFIQCAHLIKKESEGVKFIIVGAKLDTQKHCYQKLQSLASSLRMERDIIFTGKRDDIPQMLSIFDIFVLPSVSEGGPRVTLEAMAMEKPVVATDVGAVSEQIFNGETGIIVPPKDPQAMAEAVIRLLNDPEERFKMGRQGRERVKSMFSLERCVEEHRKLYENVWICKKYDSKE